MSTDPAVGPAAETAVTALTSGVDAPTFRVWLSLVHAYGHLSKSLDRALAREFGISLVWFELLARLNSAAEGRLRLSRLSQDLVVSKASVTKLVDRMERAGLVRRESAPEDRRAVYAVLTPDGRAALAEALPQQVRNVRQAFSERLDGEQLDSLETLLDTVVRGFDPDWRP
jgi:DNA-binding MarR family transcriptional regulator